MSIKHNQEELLILLQAQLTRVEFSACGFIELNWQYLFFVIATVASTVTYLIQFKEIS